MNRQQRGGKTSRRRAGEWAALIAVGVALLGAAPDVAKPEPTGATGTRRALIICGLPGDDDHRKVYAKAVETIAKALVERCGFTDSDVFVRFGTAPKQGDGPALSKSRGLSDREGIAADAAELRSRTKRDDALWVIVLGHGHLDDRAHLNLPGPDLDAKAFGKLFEGIDAREQVFLLTTSASGFFLKPLGAPGRVVITATEADQEVNETLFPLALADALAATPEEADRDADGTISVLELYLAVVADVMQRYNSDENLPTEHAQLDDNGDGRGSEVQERFLPPELGGRAEAPKDKAKKEEGKSKAKAETAEKKPAPKLGEKDDGAAAAKIRAYRADAPDVTAKDEKKETAKP